MNNWQKLCIPYEEEWEDHDQVSKKNNFRFPHGS